MSSPLSLPDIPPAGDAPLASRRIRVDGKQFRLGDQPFRGCGVTYGTFRPRPHDGARYPDARQVATDFAAMRAVGFNVVRTYTEPPDDVLDLAAQHGLRLFPGIFWPDWRYLVGSSRRQLQQIARDARGEVRAAARRLSGADQVFALSLGNEIPGDVLRWVGADRIARILGELVEVVREEDPDCLVTYANYPTAEYLPLEGLDFLTFNVFLERHDELRRYLTRLQHLAGDRPLVLGEVGLHAPPTAVGEQRQADFLDWQLETVLERGLAGSCLYSWTDEWWVGDAAVEGWHFGLTRSDRSPKPALEVARHWNGLTVADLQDDWPSLSVVICAYNAEATLDECLRHTCALDYPYLEIIVVDDGSTDSTASIVRRHPRARLVSIAHAGLSVARNEGLRASTGRIVAYLDSDAYPSPEWPYYLALGFDERTVVAAGGPNVPPVNDPIGAQVVARSPGGPVHVLTGDSRAEHIPGCNMAFWRYALEEVGGFDPVYTAAGDDVDVCWKVLDKGGEIGFHPAALVWHHRRPGLRPYLKQQRRYGRAEALVEARHPDRFSAIGTARWHGRIYNPLVSGRGRQRIYRGQFGAAAYQSVYQGGGHGLDIAHQLGVPAAAGSLLTLPLAAISPGLAVPALAALTLLAVLFVVDMVHAEPPRGLRRRRTRFRMSVASHHLLQPLARWWGRLRTGTEAREGVVSDTPLPGPIRRGPGGVLLFPQEGDRSAIATAIVQDLRAAGFRTAAASEWDDFDARVIASGVVRGLLVTSAHPPGTMQLRIRRTVAWPRLSAGATAVALLAAVDVPTGAVAGAALLADLALGWWRSGPGIRRHLASSAA